MRTFDKQSIHELSKLIYRTNVMPSGVSNSFVKLSEKLIKAYQNGNDFEKISRIVSSELIANYGLDVNQDQSDEIAEIVYDWLDH